MKVLEDSSTKSVPLLYSLVLGLQKQKPISENESENEIKEENAKIPISNEVEEPEGMIFKK